MDYRHFWQIIMTETTLMLSSFFYPVIHKFLLWILVYAIFFFPVNLIRIVYIFYHIYYIYFIHVNYENHFHWKIYRIHTATKPYEYFQLWVKNSIIFFPYLFRGRDMNNNLRMSGSMCLMLKKSSDRRQQEALENAFKVIK